MVGSRLQIIRRFCVSLAVVVILAMPAAGAAHAEMACGAPDNPWALDFAPCAVNGPIYDVPSDFCDYFGCIPSFWESTRGFVVECADGLFSHSGGRRGACSYHGGEWAPLYAY